MSWLVGFLLLFLSPDTGRTPMRAADCRLRAKLVEETGDPVPSARLGAVSLTTGEGGQESGWLAWADEEGRVELRLPRDLYRWAVASDRHPSSSGRTLDLTRSCEAAELGRIALARGSRVSGRVVTSSGAPVAGAMVRIRHDPEMPSYLDLLDGRTYRVHRETATNEAGRFELPGLSEDAEYRVRVLHPDHRPGGSTIVPGTENARSLVVELRPAARLSVKVVDPNGSPIEGARIELDNLGEAEVWSGSTVGRRTDDRGLYEAESLAPGETEIRVRTPGYEHGRRVVELTAGPGTDSVHRARFELAPVSSGPLEVRVVDEESEPVAGVVVNLTSKPRTEHGTYLSELTDASGRASWPRIPHGNYEISFQLPDGLLADRPPNLRIEVAGRPVEREVVLRRTPGRPVEGRVERPDGSTVAGATVRVKTASGVEARTDSEGGFRFEHLPYGEHTVDLDVPGVAGLPERPVRVGREPEPWIFVVPSGIPVSGNLLLGTGVEPGGEWRIVARREGFGAIRVFGWLESESSYRLPPLAPGRWTFEARTGDARGETVAEIADDESSVSLDLAVEPPDSTFPVFGTLTHLGEPLTGATVILRPMDPAFRDRRGTTDERGRFEFPEVPEATYRLSIGWDGAPVLHRTLDVDGGTDLSRELRFARVRGRVELEGVDLSSLSVRLRPQGPADPDAGWFFSTHTYPEWARLRTDGSFETGPLEEGRWTFEIEAPGHAPLRRDLLIDGHDVEDLVLSPEPTPGLTFRLVTESGRLPERLSATYWPGDGGSEIRGYFQVDSSLLHWDRVPAGRGDLRVETPHGTVGPLPVEVPGPPVEIELPPRGALRVEVPLLTESEAEAAILTVRRLGGEERPECSRPLGARVRRIEGLTPDLYRVRIDAEDGRSWREVVEVRDRETSRVLFD